MLSIFYDAVVDDDDDDFDDDDDDDDYKGDATMRQHDGKVGSALML